MGFEPLRDRLAAAGIEASGDPFNVWRRLREADPDRTTIIDYYELVAAPRGVAAHELPLNERFALRKQAMPVVWEGFEATGTQRSDEPIELAEYDPAWPRAFDRWRDVITGSLGDVAIRVEHVGSTAVPGLIAKPVIDVQLSVRDLTAEDLYVGPLERAGLQLRSRDDSHRYLQPFPDRPRDVHVHVCDIGSEWERSHLLFRDYLRSHPDAASAYAEVKRDAARVWADDRIAYTEAKTAVIKGILDDAEAWADASGWRV